MIHEIGQQYYLQYSQKRYGAEEGAIVLTSMEMVLLEKFVFNQSGKVTHASVKTMDGRSFDIAYPTQSLLPLSSTNRCSYYGKGKYGRRRKR